MVQNSRATKFSQSPHLLSCFMMGNPITVQIRPSNGQVFQVEFDPETTTVKQLKEIIAEKRNGVNADSLKLVYSGRILKDDDLCSTCSTFIQGQYGDEEQD